MITWEEGKTVRRDGEKKKYLKGSCLAADSKPTEGIANGSTLVEMDSGKVYMFNEAGGTWVEFGG